ncbi:4'-phosphopantetheinyl transferase family protein [Thermodesulfobacteriota bacterium]
MPKETTLYPVVLSVPAKDRQLKGKKKVTALSRYARQALEISAYKSGVFLKDLHKDDDGTPLPFDGYYWSLSHKSTYACGVIATSPVGIDIEKIRPVAKPLFKRTASETEWALSTEDALHLFFRYWTAKEAVLKAATTGIKGLAKCRVISIVDAYHLVITYQDKEWLVEHFIFEKHIVSVVKVAEHIEWVVAEDFKVIN